MKRNLIPKILPFSFTAFDHDSYQLLLQLFNNEITYTNPYLLSAFINPAGNIKSLQEVNISICFYKKIVKAIKKARFLKLLKYTYNVELTPDL